MLPDPHQHNPTFHRRALDSLDPYFRHDGFEWDDLAQMYFDWCYQYEDIHYPIESVEVVEDA